MKSWKFTKVENNTIAIDEWITDAMGLVEGGYIYSTLFKYPQAGCKRYELILTMYPQENFRTLTNITVYMEDEPGATVQAAKYLADQGINILNSVSLTGISDTTIIWTIMAELSFAGEGDIIKERFAKLKEENSSEVSKINYISIKPANIGRIFRKGDSSLKEELRHGSPMTLSGSFDLKHEYGDLLNDVDGTEVLITVDPSAWLVSIVFFKPDTELIKVSMEIPDCPGSINKALDIFAKNDINLISVFSKVMIAYQTMVLETVMDMKDSKIDFETLKTQIPECFDAYNGIFTLKNLERL